MMEFTELLQWQSEMPRDNAVIVVGELVQRSGYLLGTTIVRFGAATRMVMLHGQGQEESHKYTFSAGRKCCKWDEPSCMYTDVIVALFVREVWMRFLYIRGFWSAPRSAAGIR